MLWYKVIANIGRLSNGREQFLTSVIMSCETQKKLHKTAKTQRGEENRKQVMIRSNLRSHPGSSKITIISRER